MLGWPVVARPVEVFETYSLSLLRPRSVLVMISTAEETPEASRLAKLAHQRGCTLLLVTNAPESPLAKIADHVFMVRAEGDVDVPAVTVCLHAALNYLVFVVARLVKRHEGQGDSLAREFEQLPTHLDWVLTQLSQSRRVRWPRKSSCIPASAGGGGRLLSIPGLARRPLAASFGPYRRRRDGKPRNSLMAWRVRNGPACGAAAFRVPLQS